MAYFEKDLQQLKNKLADKIYAQAMYAAICNNVFVNVKEAPKEWERFLEVDQERFYRKTRIKQAIHSVIDFIRIPFARYGYKMVETEHYTDGKPVKMRTMVPRTIIAFINHQLLRLESKFWCFYRRPDWLYSCSWRYCGSIIAQIRDMGEDYLDFYCSGSLDGVSEGIITDEVERDLKMLGWIAVNTENE